MDYHWGLPMSTTNVGYQCRQAILTTNVYNHGNTFLTYCWGNMKSILGNDWHTLEKNVWLTHSLKWIQGMLALRRGLMIFGGNPPLLDAHQPFPHSAHIVEGWSYIAEGDEWCVTLPSVALCTRGPPSCGALWVKLFSIRIAKKIYFLVVVGTSPALSRRRR